MRRLAQIGGLGAASALVLSGCADEQSTLAPHSDAAQSIDTLWWVLFVISTVVVGIVTLLVCLSLLKRRGRLDVVHDRTDTARARTVVLVSGAAVPALILVGLFIYVLTVVPDTAEPKARDAQLTIDVTGRQWFWDVRYPEQRIRTANELHIPVDTAVRVRTHTGDVIHSFWVPELNRKIDMVPGYDNSILLDANRTGVYRGQCAEFCGLQHANMAFYVVVQSAADFRRWVARERGPAHVSAAGAKVFTDVGCGACHRIEGVSDGRVGPDLTHLGSRMTLAAGTIPNARGWLGGWILDPQHVKPGNKMPALPVSGPDLNKLIDYLESLE